jgi:plasmid stabilization system protein ParE
VKARFSPRALRRMKVVATWWRQNRRAVPTLFDDELDAAIDRLKDRPDSGAVYQTIGGEIIRRTLLPKSAQYVYYAVDTVNEVIVIYTIWGARRGRGPKL